MASDAENAQKILSNFDMEHVLKDVSLLDPDTLDGALQTAFADGWKRAWLRATGKEFVPNE